MRTTIAHLQKYYGVYLLILAVVFMILWLQNRTAHRYATIILADRELYILDTRTGQVWLEVRAKGSRIGTTTEATFIRVKFEEPPPKKDIFDTLTLEEMATTPKNAIGLPEGFELDNK